MSKVTKDRLPEPPRPPREDTPMRSYPRQDDRKPEGIESTFIGIAATAISVLVVVILYAVGALMLGDSSESGLPWVGFMGAVIRVAVGAIFAFAITFSVMNLGRVVKFYLKRFGL